MSQETEIQSREGAGAVGREGSRGGNAPFSPLCDIYETADELVLLADMPGTGPDQVDLKFENGLLTIYGRCAQRRPESGRAVLAEYGVGDYYRSFEINEDIDAEKIAAELRNGVLTVRLPKLEAAKPRKIPVRAGA